MLFGLREQEKELSSELSGGQAQSKNLGSKLNQLGDEVSFLPVSDTHQLKQAAAAVVSVRLLIGG